MPMIATSNKIILILEILSYKNLNSCFEIHVQNELFTSIRAKLVLLSLLSSLAYAGFRMPMVPEYSKVYSAKVYLPILIWGGTYDANLLCNLQLVRVFSISDQTFDISKFRNQ